MSLVTNLVLTTFVDEHVAMRAVNADLERNELGMMRGSMWDVGEHGTNTTRTRLV